MKSDTKVIGMKSDTKVIGLTNKGSKIPLLHETEELLKPAAATFRSIFPDSNLLLVFTKPHPKNGWLDMGGAACKNTVILSATAGTEGPACKNTVISRVFHLLGGLKQK
ncbi:MAG: hypothetical protein K0R57_1225 [Paenibacillaceae bacterium]|jgi:hypothetical protein|nr:hypothetical protein [Paenibacillaceae bacterium]